MSPEQFVKVRRTDWERLTVLMTKARKNVRQLPPQEVAEIGRLYRTLTSDLALSQRDYPTHDVTRYLNQLTAQAHALLYQGNPFGIDQIKELFAKTIPQTFRETKWFTLVAALLFFVPAILSAIATVVAPNAVYLLMPAEIQPILSDIENHEIWFSVDSGEKGVMSSSIITNNIRVSFLAFAGGMTAGLLTIYVLIFNGLMLGTITGYSIRHDFASTLWNFVIGHGVIELGMICVAGGAGLMFAWAIIHPTPYSRANALLLAGRKALILAFAGAVFLIVAGIIEGFISPHGNGIAPIVKWLVGIGGGAAVFAYLSLIGREKG